MSLPRPKLRYYLGALTCLLFILPFSQRAWPGTLSQIGTGRHVHVARIFDGDTFRTDDGEKVRLLNINTPEVAHDNTPGQPMAQQARELLVSLIDDQEVKLSFDADRRDSYGRLLAHIFLDDGTWVNGVLVERGMAHSYIFAPNFERCEAIQAKERDARRQKLGIWKTARFAQLDAADVDRKHIGQFRVVSGRISRVNRDGWGFKMKRLSVSIPRRYRQWFKVPPGFSKGEEVTVHGTIRLSSGNRLYLALHSACDLERVR